MAMLWTAVPADRRANSLTSSNSSFELPNCNQTNLKASDIVHELPESLANFPTPRMLDVARFLSIWTSAGTITERTMLILNPRYKTLAVNGLALVVSTRRGCIILLPDDDMDSPEPPGLPCRHSLYV
ncbi:hypothetical protein Aduo_018819 [Ancylostoma duodenale]